MKSTQPIRPADRSFPDRYLSGWSGRSQGRSLWRSRAANPRHGLAANPHLTNSETWGPSHQVRSFANLQATHLVSDPGPSGGSQGRQAEQLWPIRPSRSPHDLEHSIQSGDRASQSLPILRPADLSVAVEQGPVERVAKTILARRLVQRTAGVGDQAESIGPLE